MRAVAAIPVILSVAALILSFLCLFAGSKKGFMEDYAVVTLNTSRIGQNLLNDTDPSNSSSSDSSIWDKITGEITSEIQDIENEIEDAISDAITSIARDLGLHDFYSMHLLDFCEGYYTPGPVPNATLSKSDISKNVTSCSNRTSMYTFDPREVLQKELNDSTVSQYINLTSIDWPDSIDEGLHALHTAMNAMFVLYCVGIALIALALVTALIGVFAEGKIATLINWIVDLLAFLIIAAASAISTAIAVKASNVFNKYGKEIGVSASRGNKFMAMTWAATALMFIATFVWCFACFQGRRNRTDRPKKTAYDG